MPTNEERSDVAARLRNYENLRESFRESPICAFLDALEVEYLDWKSICNLLADLIEPEPEHITTRHGKFKIRYGNKIPLCEYCGYSIGDKRYSYCPNCGAKITSGKDTDVITNIRSVK